MSERQYVQVRFNGKPRLYTYHNDGQPVQKGDLVAVSTPRGEKHCRVEHTFSAPAPGFVTVACAKVDVEATEEGADA